MRGAGPTITTTPADESMAAAAASSKPHRSAIVRPRSSVISSSRVRVGANPACVASSPAEVKQGPARQQHRRYRSRDEKKPSPLVRRRRRDDDGARDDSPDTKRRESVSYHRDVRRGLSSSIRPSSTGAKTHRRDRDGPYRAAKKQESDEHDHAREDMTRKESVSSGASQYKQRARKCRSSAVAILRPRGAAAVDDRKPTPEKVETAEDETEVRRAQDIQRQREEARREMDKMVKTVEFNDPFISPMDVLKPLLASEVWTKEWRNRGRQYPRAH